MSGHDTTRAKSDVLIAFAVTWLVISVAIMIWGMMDRALGWGTLTGSVMVLVIALYLRRRRQPH
jgi:hypothetical protein